MSTPKFIEEQLSKGEKVKTIVVQTKYVIFKETLAFTDRRLITYRSGFLYRITQDYPYDNIISIRSENSRPIECLIAFLISLIAIAIYSWNIDLSRIAPTDYPSTVYFSFAAGIVSALVIAYYVYRSHGRLKALATGGVLLVILAGLWFYLHYILPPLSQITLNFFATNPYTSPMYLNNPFIFDEFVTYVFSKIASDTSIIFSIIYGVIALICFIVRLSLILLTIEESWETVTFHPYNPEIIKLIREHLRS